METYEPYATDENREQLAADLEAYRVGYLKKMYAYLDSHSRVMSTMITGPSNFPTRTNQKRSESADKRLNEWLDYNARGQKRLDKTYDPRMIARAARVIRSDEDDPISRLRAKLAKLEEIHEIQKAANKIVRSKKLSRDEKIAQLAEIDGISENTAQQLLSPDFAGRLGFPSYQLSNRSAEMRRIRQRIEGLEMEAARPDAEDVELENGVIIHENVELSRIQIIFPGIPAENIRAALKSRGFRWSRREGAWQRLLNNNARLAVQQLMSTINGGA